MTVRLLCISLLRILFWAGTLPLIGLFLIGALNGPSGLLGLMFLVALLQGAPVIIAMMIGFLPSMFPATAFVILRGRLSRLPLVVVVAGISASAAWHFNNPNMIDWRLLLISALATLPMTLRKGADRSAAEAPSILTTTTRHSREGGNPSPGPTEDANAGDGCPPSRE